MTSRSNSPVVAAVYVQGPQKVKDIPGFTPKNREDVIWEANFIFKRKVQGASKEDCWKQAKDRYVAPVLEFEPAA